MNHSTSLSATEDKALKLLGSGLGPEIVANATGVTTSRISQLLSDPQFAAQVSELRFKNLQKHNDRDDKYDSLEDTLLRQLKDVLPLMMRPLEIIRAISVINSAKRRGASSPQEVTNHNTIVSLTLPINIIQKFTTNINNQVISAGSQDLVTVQSSAMQKLVATKISALEVTASETTVIDTDIK
jgi:hypothetical protein